MSFVRIYARLETDWCRGLAEPVELPGAVVFASAEFPMSIEANSVANAWLPAGQQWDELSKAVVEHQTGTECRRWWINPSMPTEQTRPVVDGLLIAGYRPVVEPLMRWSAFDLSPAAAAGVTIIPARAAFRAVAESAAARDDATAVAHLDDPQVDAWVALSAGRAVGTVTLQVSGEAAALREWYVDPASRRRGIGRLLLARAFDLGRRAGVPTVLAVGAEDELNKVGFVRVGDWTVYVR
jgi:GNAT superfamily N-acetyltransferase